MGSPLPSDDAIRSAPYTAASAAVHTGTGLFYGLICTASSSLVVAVYDAASATGNPIWGGAMTAGQVVTFGGKALPISTGLYINFVSGTGAVRALIR